VRGERRPLNIGVIASGPERSERATWRSGSSPAPAGLPRALCALAMTCAVTITRSPLTVYLLPLTSHLSPPATLYAGSV
jgi:hypothetical protein